MNALIKLFARVSVFRAGPEDMPYIPALLGALWVAWMVLQLVSGLLQTGLTLALVVGVQLLSLAVLLGATAGVLAFKGLLGRWLQTAIALIGVDILLTLLALPLLLVGPGLRETPGLADGLYLLLVSWQLALQSFIFHRAFSVGPLLGLAMAFGLLIVTFMLVGALMPEVLQTSS